MLTASVEALGLKPVFDILEKIGFPKEPPFGNNVSALDVSTIAGVAQRVLGQNLLVNLYISEDVSDTTKNRIMVNKLTTKCFLAIFISRTFAYRDIRTISADRSGLCGYLCKSAYLIFMHAICIFVLFFCRN